LRKVDTITCGRVAISQEFMEEAVNFVVNDNKHLPGLTEAQKAAVAFVEEKDSLLTLLYSYITVSV